MRDESGRRGQDGDDGQAGERAQLLIIGALGIAVAFVALALILNSSIFTQILSTRPGPTGGAATDYGHAVQNGVGGLLAETNYYDHGSMVQARLRGGIQNWSQTVANRNGVYSKLTNVRVESMTPGTMIRQPYTRQGSARNFTDANGNTSWTLFGSATGVRNVRLSVNNSNALASNKTNAFKINATGRHQDYHIPIYRNGSRLVIGGANYSVSYPVRINASNASIGGKHASTLKGFENATITKMRFENAGNITGRYAAVAAESNSSVSASHYNQTTRTPAKFAAVYSVTVRSTYRGPRVMTNRTETITPASPQRIVPKNDWFGVS